MKTSFMKRKSSDKKSSTVSATELSSYRFSNTSFDIPEGHGLLFAPYDPLRKSVSLELLTTIDSEELGGGEAMDPLSVSHSHRTISPEGAEQFQGYLRVQRRGADSMWVRYWCILEGLAISCYISQRDLTLTLSIHLRGSRIAEAYLECKREHSFKVGVALMHGCVFENLFLSNN